VALPEDGSIATVELLSPVDDSATVYVGSIKPVDVATNENVCPTPTEDPGIIDWMMIVGTESTVICCEVVAVSPKLSFIVNVIV
jgi:hypothetical protein